MVLIQNFRSTNVWKAFTLNALATSFAICIGLIMKSHLEKYVDDKGNVIKNVTDPRSMIFTFIITFAGSFCAFTALHFVFGYGGGMLVPTKN